ncbi:MAG: DUF1572 family protein [Planctomycetes bacterium]|nr:DUF1572 family protein [Planctomycetota bacterium]
MAEAENLGKALIRACRDKLVEEFLPRLKKCLSRLTDGEIWFRSNENTASVGNLILHLCGNVRQHIVSGLGGAPDVRERSKEFSERGPIPAEELLRRINRTVSEAVAVMDRLDPDHLLDARRIQGFETNALSTLIHVTEHFSYHLGQITYAVKTRKNIDLGYYAGVDLNRKNE